MRSLRLGLSLSGGSSASLHDSGASNLVSNAQAFDNAAWTLAAAGVSANAAVAPDATTTADTLTETAANTQHYAQSAVFATTFGVQMTATVFAKPASGTRMLQLCGDSATAGTGGVTFNLQTQAVTPVAGNNSSTGAIVTLPNGWFQCSWTFTPPGSGSTSLYLLLVNSTTIFPAYLGDGTTGIHLWQAEAVAGSSPGPIYWS